MAVNAKNRKKLVVDDEPGIRSLTSEVVTALGFDVETAETGLKR